MSDKKDSESNVFLRRFGVFNQPLSTHFVVVGVVVVGIVVAAFVVVVVVVVKYAFLIT